jgi:dTDP-4-dehydrorhamnose 3,5-epimerase
MKLIPLGIEGAWLATSQVWEDQRGFFREWFKSAEVEAETGLKFEVKQANISRSDRGVVRGIHYSLAAAGQHKWITCTFGEINDVIVDIRPGSTTEGEYVSINLNGESGNAVLIQQGLGHAFVSLVDESTVAYLVSSPFSPSEEYEINPLDTKFGINWGLPISELSLSPKDKSAPNWQDQFSMGNLPLG